MTNIIKEIKLQELILKAISILSSRSQEIIKRRFGILNGKPETLEAIGKSFGITRERVRQIEEAALRQIKKSPKNEEWEDCFLFLKEIFKKNGGIAEEKRILETISKGSLDKCFPSAVRFLLILNPQFVFVKEKTNEFYSFWHLQDVDLKQIFGVIKAIKQYLLKLKTPAFLSVLLKEVQDIIPGLTEEALESFLKISKEISNNLFQEYGLITWPEIEPTGVKDRAYILMKHFNKPLHFTKIADLINQNRNNYEIIRAKARAVWQRKIQIQTVHNELIKDSRFVLIGRGIYALRDWGYKPGKVIEVIKEVLKEKGGPLSASQIVEEVKKRRLVKENTILINLQNKRYFKKLPDKSYTLIKPYRTLET